MASELHFGAAEIMVMGVDELAWWLERIAELNER